MITCKEDLVNTYIENDFGELRDLYVKKAVELGFRLDWLSHSPAGPSNKIVATCHWNGEECAFTGQTSYLPISTVDMSTLRKLTLSDLKPEPKHFVSKALEESIKETASEQFEEFIKKAPIFTPCCRSSSVDLNQEKPRTKVEYEHLDQSNFNVWDLKPLLDNGELYSKTSDGEYDQYSKSSPTYMLRHFMEYGVYRKVERQVEWWEDAVEYLNSKGGFDASGNSEEGLWIRLKANTTGVAMTRDQWCDFARILLEQEGE
ncbi:hypothetical protein PP409_gp03 [Vibrio phage Seahorse]|uniref:Uncharacterized protein n=1 Tax=Vibrio phage Seahorse TaxID=2662136 RepID=A0A6B7SEQ0_9CAUD|nr:hypothetical protein PP409_gp03 [Vibrio phage Seahorse]QGF20985.1 hypothetical protein [Vibrio phage Seahorse]